MLKRLASMGLVTHQPYRGTELTEAGERVALEVIRHHRLLELYLAEALGMCWDRVHAEAEVLEHAISPELSELIAAKLGNPTHDPHGDPIPTADGVDRRAGDRAAGRAGARPSGRVHPRLGLRPEMLRYLSSRGIAPGDALEVLERQPFEGPLTVRFGSSEHALGGTLARDDARGRGPLSPAIGSARGPRRRLRSASWTACRPTGRSSSWTCGSPTRSATSTPPRCSRRSTPCPTPSTTGTAACGWPTSSATPPRHQTVAGTLALLDHQGVEGELVAREARSGRVEIREMWGRPESVRQELRRRWAQ